MKALAESTLYGLYKYSGAMYAQERFAILAGRRCAAVLLFHRVTDAIPPDGLTVTTSWFRDFCGLMKTQFNVISLTQLHRMLQTKQTFAPGTVAITFDDCYRDNLFAARVLFEHGLPATFFIPSKYVGTDHVFEWDRHLPRMPNLSWDDVHEMIRLGHDIGSHTVSHPDMGAIGAEQARSELTESKATLEAKLERPVRWFAYPYGGRNNFCPEYLPLAQELGYEMCFSAHGGFVDSHMLGQMLPREATPYFRSLLKLELHLRGCLDWVYQMKRSVGLVSY